MGVVPVSTENKRLKSHFEKLENVFQKYDEKDPKNGKQNRKKNRSRLYPYIGKIFYDKSGQDERNYPNNRRLLVIDSCLKSEYEDVKDQVHNDRGEKSLKNYLSSFDDIINVDDLVYHCFIMRPVNLPIKIEELSSEDLKQAVDILSEIIKWSKPNVILVLDDELEKVICKAYQEYSSMSFPKTCEAANIYYSAIDLESKEKRVAHEKTLVSGWDIPQRNDFVRWNLQKELLPKEHREKALERTYELIKEIKDELLNLKDFVCKKKDRYGEEFDFEYQDFMMSICVDEKDCEWPISYIKTTNLSRKGNPSIKTESTLKVDLLAKELNKIMGSLYKLQENLKASNFIPQKYICLTKNGKVSGQTKSKRKA